VQLDGVQQLTGKPKKKKKVLFHPNSLHHDGKKQASEPSCTLLCESIVTRYWFCTGFAVMIIRNISLSSFVILYSLN